MYRMGCRQSSASRIHAYVQGSQQPTLPASKWRSALRNTLFVQNAAHIVPVACVMKFTLLLHSFIVCKGNTAMFCLP